MPAMPSVCIKGTLTNLTMKPSRTAAGEDKASEYSLPHADSCGESRREREGFEENSGCKAIRILAEKIATAAAKSITMSNKKGPCVLYHEPSTSK